MKFGLVLLLIFLILFGLVALMINADVNATNHDVFYRVFYIEGMPCMRIGNTTTFNGVTCDWSKWKGNNMEIEQ